MGLDLEKLAEIAVSDENGVPYKVEQNEQNDYLFNWELDENGYALVTEEDYIELRDEFGIDVDKFVSLRKEGKYEESMELFTEIFKPDFKRFDGKEINESIYKSEELDQSPEKKNIKDIEKIVIDNDRLEIGHDFLQLITSTSLFSVYETQPYFNKTYAFDIAILLAKKNLTQIRPDISNYLNYIDNRLISTASYVYTNLMFFILHEAMSVHKPNLVNFKGELEESVNSNAVNTVEMFMELHFNSGVHNKSRINSFIINEYSKFINNNKITNFNGFINASPNGYNVNFLNISKVKRTPKSILRYMRFKMK